MGDFNLGFYLMQLVFLAVPLAMAGVNAWIKNIHGTVFWSSVMIVVQIRISWGF